MDREIISTIKSLGIDMINEAGSGHPGIVLGAAPIIYTLYSRHLNININDPLWANRDRFVLSAGHGSALLYSTLYMAGYNLTLDDLRNFRKIGKTPGHPEYGVTPGVEMSTGPLGQGIASAVGMALAAKIMEKRYQLPKKSKMGKDRSLINYNVYVLCGDGDLMEGIANEAASLAGTWKLNNLIVLYDSNNICLDGKTDVVFNENVLKRFEAMGWNTEYVKDGLSVTAIDKAITRAKESSKPTIIEIKTIIGQGAMGQGTNEVHGKPLSKEDYFQLKEKLNMPLKEPFYVDPKCVEYFRNQIVEHSSKKYEEWSVNYQEYLQNNLQGDVNKMKQIFEPYDSFKMPDDIQFDKDMKEATRVTNEYVMNKFADDVPNFIGGSADLSSSTKAYIRKSDVILPDKYDGKNICFGVREHAMGAILNGLAISNFRVFGSTFLSFADYLKPAIRMSALMNLPVTYIFSHDSINVGEDGPTHQPIEQLASLRCIPNVRVYRPADGHELVGCWESIMNDKTHPSALILSRNDVNLIPTTNNQNVNKGAYIVRKEENGLHAIIIATGTEVHTALYIANDLYKEFKLDIRVVSMPSMELFNEQPIEYQKQILPDGYRKIVIEAGSQFGWEKFVYNPNYLITLDKFGVSGKRDQVLKYMEFDYQTIKEKIKKLLLK